MAAWPRSLSREMIKIRSSPSATLRRSLVPKEKKSAPVPLRCAHVRMKRFYHSYFCRLSPLICRGGNQFCKLTIGDILMSCKMSGLSFLVSVCRCVDYCFRSLILCGVLHAHLNFLPQFPSSEIAAHEIGGLHPEPARHRQQP